MPTKKIINLISKAYRFVYFVVYHFIKDDCTYIASALTFTTLLALVPLITVSFAIFSSFPVFGELSVTVQNFIFDNFVPATGTVIQEYLQQFSTQVTKLSAWGIAFLFVTAILVMYTIEGAMNSIWKTHTKRKGISAFLLYWAILSLAPFMLGLSLVVSSYIASIPLLQHHTDTLQFLRFMPFILSFAGFTFLYVVVPNCKVKVSHGLWGGLIAGVLFEASKMAFAYYLKQYNTYQLLYGAFATVPLFFIWIYWVWLITLLGAEISYALSAHHQRRNGKPVDGFLHNLLWLYQLWVAQKKGVGLSINDLIDTTCLPYAKDPDTIITKLLELNLIHRDPTGNYRLSRDLNYLTINTLYEALPYRLPSAATLAQKQVGLPIKLQQDLLQITNYLENNLQDSLETLFTEYSESNPHQPLVCPDDR